MSPLGLSSPPPRSGPRRPWRACLLALGLVAGLAGSSGCATVSPYERGDLSRPGMDTSREAGEAGFHAHVNDSREGATGGNTSTGGGCGCN